MALSSDIVSQFVKITNDDTQKKTESTVYGKIVNDGNTKYVRIDGSEILTPVESTTAIKDGDRVSVMIKDHTAIVTGNLTSPSTNDDNVAAAISEFDIVIASKVSTTEFDAEKARIDDLVTKNVTITSQLNANSASITNLSTDNLAVHKELSAASASITNLQASMLTAADAEIKYATIENLNVTNETVRNLSGDYASFKEMVTVKLDTQVITTEYLNANYANIGLTNVDHANISKLLADVGLITDATISEGHVTGYLDSVKINANDITAGTLTVDRLIIAGSDKSIVYALNNSGTLESTHVDTIDGGLITERTITAKHIVAETITANEIHSSAITTDKIMVGAITADKIATGTITTNNLAAACITADEIASATITTDKLAADCVTAEKINVDSLSAICAKIGGFDIGSTCLYNGSEIIGTVNSVYFGIDGISCGTNFIAKKDGTVKIKGDIYCSYGGLWLWKEKDETPAGYIKVLYYDNDSLMNEQHTFVIAADQIMMHNTTISSLTVNDNSYFHGDTTFTSPVTCSSSITASEYYTNGWFRSNGPSGWYSETFGGGIHMIDPTWVRVYNGKSFYSPNVIQAEGELQSVGQISLRMRRYPKNVLLYHDASDFYIFISNSDKGGANSLRPFRINKTSGDVYCGNRVYGYGGHRLIYTGGNNVYNLSRASGYIEIGTDDGAKGVNYWNSDSRLKKDIAEANVDALKIINNIKHYAFGWKSETDPRTVKLGYIAQQLEEVEEQLVFKVSQSDGYMYPYLYQIDETHLIPYLTKAIQEISLLDDERDLKIERLQKQAYELQFQIQKLQNGGNQVC